MGRQGSDPTMVSSSIALLQERFRQLQKVKERREEQQFLQTLPENERIAPPSTRHFESAKVSFQSDMVVPPLWPTTPVADSSLSLGLNLQTKQVEYRGMNSTRPFATSSATTSTTAWKKSDHSELDTSLHL